MPHTPSVSCARSSCLSLSFSATSAQSPPMVGNLLSPYAEAKDMAASAPRKIWQTLAAIKTGVVLLILVVILSAAGTVILQRPATEPDEMLRAYSPHVLRLLDALGLTDVFHAWWFVLLLSLVSLSIIAASVQRFPNAWRFFSRPYKSPDEMFRKALATHKFIPVSDEATALSVDR